MTTALRLVSRFLAGTSPVKGGAGVALGTAAAALEKFAKNGIDG